MKKFTIITVILMTANLLFAQYNKIDTSFYSQALGEEKMVDIYFPPGYDENPNWHYPVIYYLHGWNDNNMGVMLYTLQELINNGTIEPVIMVGADNYCLPFGGSYYVNSVLWGDYEDYMVSDLIDWIDSSFRTIPGRDARALLGHSMGGYGAFRYGILHKDKFRALSSFAGAINRRDPYFVEQFGIKVFQENQPGPTFFYDFYNTGSFTMSLFLASGAWTPNLNSQQIYINPQNVDFPADEYGDPIDTIGAKSYLQDIAYLIHQLSPVDSVGILFGCGSNDQWLLYPMNITFKDSLDLMGLPYEFYDCTSGHAMPAGFKQRSFIFLDSLLMPPGIYTGTHQTNQKIIFGVHNYPNPFDQTTNIEFSLKEERKITVSIYNQLGEKIAIIFNGIKEKGIHQLTWDSENLPSGIYFIELQTDQSTTAQKIIKK